VADDILTRLRDDESVFVDTNLLHEVADEIERLRAAGDALATRLRWWTDGTDASYPDHQALQTWNEIRRD
jgi:hypothetical protein